MTAWARAIDTGWLVRDEVPGPGVDEFAEPAEVTEALAAVPAGQDTLLAVQHPHRTPAARAAGLSLAAALPAARETLDRLCAKDYRRVDRVVAAYRAAGSDGVAEGVLCVVEPAAVDPDGTLRVRPGEQVYPEVVAERAAVLAGLGCATSAAMLVPVHEGARLTEAVRMVIGAAGEPSAAAVDPGGNEHLLWLLGPGGAQDRLLAEVRRGPLLVADGNHRVAAAERAGGGLVALVTAGPDLHIGAIHRALAGTGLGTAELAAAWRGCGLTVTETADPVGPETPGTVVVRPIARPADPGLVVRLPDGHGPRPRIDHELVEHVLLAEALGLDPAGEHVRALPEGHPAERDVDVLLRLAPVPYADVLAVHEQGRRMPRKATYFTPKPRSGLLLADLGDNAASAELRR